MMFEMDKAKFGAFVAQLRKERGMTQKELAQKLYISDKAVSKWETGVNTPDVALLIPLAELLDVTVTELLECERMEVQQPVEELVKKAVSYSEESAEDIRAARRGRLWKLLWHIVIAIAEIFVVLQLHGGYTVEATTLPIILVLGTVFSVYFWVFAREKLPAYYDENPISSYADGFFRMNVPGFTFHNGNWPHILRVGRIWTLAMLNGYPVAWYLCTWMLGDAWSVWGENALTMLCLLGLIVPLYIVGKKYE